MEIYLFFEYNLYLSPHIFFSNFYFERKESYETAMGEMFKKIPKNDGIKLTPSEKNKQLITDIGGRWHLEKM